MSSIIIIGATGGIGAALSRRLARAGHTIHAIGRDPAKLEALTAETGGTPRSTSPSNPRTPRSQASPIALAPST
jgi:uncharacterized protein YbjT (DUF2867 family)